MFLELSSLTQPRTLRTVPNGVAALPQPGATMLLRWTMALIRAGVISYRLKTASDESGLKALISRWQKIHRGHVDRKDVSPGLEFVVSSTTLTSGGDARRWTGRLILIYERKSDSLFHYIVEVGVATGASTDLIWFAVDQAIKSIEKTCKCKSVLSELRTVFLPSCLFGMPINTELSGGASNFRIAKKERRPMLIVWPKGNEFEFDVGQWCLKWYIGRSHCPIMVKLKGINELRREMSVMATIVSKSLRDRRGTLNPIPMNDPVTPSWKKLNSVRARVRKSPHRFDR